jgi:16S rRNA (guanine966-N2)-methyltransferase
VTRIISGQARGRRLRTPAGETTRPTADRVREALFSALEADLGSLAGLRFLDLYAGSGAVGLEAMSRGAGALTSVESDRRVARVVEENAATLGFREVEVLSRPVARVLGQPPRAPFDVVFADPPYPLENAQVESVLAQLLVHGWLVPGAVLVLERSARSVEPAWPRGLVRDRERKYGETVLWYVRADPAGPHEQEHPEHAG